MRVLSKRATAAKVNYSVPHIDKMVSQGRFPRKIQLGPNKIGFLESEVDAWIEERVRERDAADKTDAGADDSTVTEKPPLNV
ncbi:MAG: AlpA family phage regulatory protein [Alphaproteobacteria bacterium]|jgi:prophage regulatory protein|nr:AlpA family phage regulatory protein [Alphaproteobacteria bacterium]